MKCRITRFSLILAMLVVLPQMAASDPVSLRDDVKIRKVLQLPKRTMRIAKDPRDNTLYTLTAMGTISRVLLKGEDERVGPRIARGLLNVDTGEFSWAHFDPNGEVPAGVPLADVLAAGEEGLARMQNPVSYTHLTLPTIYSV